jgi:hypothetical protein
MKRFFYGINRLKRQINLLHGYEIKNRHILKIAPMGGLADRACQQHTGLVMQAMTAFGGYDLLSEAFRYGSLISGSNLIEIYKDRTGNTQFGRLGYNEFLLDPYIKRTDLSDCGGIIVGRWLPSDTVKILLPKNSDKIPKESKMQTSNRWSYQSPPFSNEDKRFLFEQWWQKKTKFITKVSSRMSGNTVTFDDMVAKLNGDENYANKLIKETRLPDGNLALEKYQEPYNEIKLSVFVNDEEVWSGDNPLGIDDFNHLWIHGEFAPEVDRSELKLQSFARILRDPQRMLDRRLNQAMDIIESQIQSGRIARDEFIKNPEAIYKSGQGVVIHIKDGVAAGTPLSEIFSQIPPAQIGAGIFQLMEILEQSETMIGGLNNEILGNDDKDIPGVLATFRTGQALTGQQGIFSGFRQAKRQMGVKLVKAHQKNYPPEKVQRIIGEIPVPTFYEPDFTKYDCTPVEGLLTESQQMSFWLELKEIRAMFPDAAQMLPLSVMLEYYPTEFKGRLKEMVKQNEQKMAEMNKAAMEDKMRLDKAQEVQTQLKSAQIEEAITQSIENRANAQLDNAKTMTETKDLQASTQLNIIDRMIKLEDLKLQNARLAAQERNRNKKKP